MQDCLVLHGGQLKQCRIAQLIWTAPRNLGDAVNTPGVEQRATLSADGRRLYFGRDGDIYVSSRSGKH